MIRKHYRALINDTGVFEEAVKHDTSVLKQAVKGQKIMTAALYRHGNMLFLYMEALKQDCVPEELFPEITKTLELWPDKENMTQWKFMYPIYYHCVPENEKQWAREGKKVRRGRIAYLKPDKLFSYVYYHKAIVDEGLLEGDKYQSIALHEDVLFSYFEEPKIFCHIKKDENKESEVIKEWMKVDPESHFDHELSGEGNFLFIDEVMSAGAEDM